MECSFSNVTDIITDYGGGRAHFSILRMFCVVYDAMSYLNRPSNITAQIKLTVEQMEQYLDHYLLVAHWRDRWYLDLLHSDRS